MDERNGNRCTGHGDVWAIAVFAKSCIDSLVVKLGAIPDEQRRQAGHVLDLLMADAHAAAFEKRFKTDRDPITYTQAVWLATGLLWNRIPYSRANNTTRPEDALPHVYDYEMQAVKALGDESVLQTVIQQSSAKKLAFDALKACIASLRRDKRPIPDALEAWALDVGEGSHSRPHRGREQTTEVRDAVISRTVHILTQCGLSKTRNETSLPHSACDAVGQVLGMRYATVVKACNRAVRLPERRGNKVGDFRPMTD